MTWPQTGDLVRLIVAVDDVADAEAIERAILARFEPLREDLGRARERLDKALFQISKLEIMVKLDLLTRAHAEIGRLRAALRWLAENFYTLSDTQLTTTLSREEWDAHVAPHLGDDG